MSESQSNSGSVRATEVSGNNATEASGSEVSRTATGESTNHFIPGLAPVDVYLNFEEEGFKTEKILSGGEFGYTWTNKSNVEGIEYRVTTFSTEIEKVEAVRATAMVDPSIKNIIATKPFLFYIASLPYEKAEPQTVQNWIEANFNNDKASTTVNGVRFTIYAPTKMLRMLDVEKSR